MLFTGLAPAKINLFLHILGRRSDGYHNLESLVMFADHGDRLSLDLSRPLDLEVSGPFANLCRSGADNLVMKAAQALRAHIPDLETGAFALEKNLPVAAGMGGGSADAAVALRLLAKANDIFLNDASVKAATLEIGADVPVCLYGQTVLMRGVGEELEPVAYPKLNAVLVNCGVPLATRDIFAKLKLNEKTPAQFGKMPKSFTEVIEWLSVSANDLAPAARELCPQISNVENELAETGAALVRMSGSGATVFGLHENKQHANQAATQLQQQHQRWWVKAVTLG